jgi:hypothetical protein
MVDPRATDPRHRYGGAERQAADSYWLELVPLRTEWPRIALVLDLLRNL